ATPISTQRQSDPKRLSQLLRGELDWIVMKCLEKDRNRRYETANGLARDIERYLHDEPVLACPPSLWYRTGKFLRRNKKPALAVALVALALVGGIIGMTWGMIRAMTESEEKGEALRQEKAAVQKKEEALAQVSQEKLAAKINLSTFLLDKGLGLCEQGEV